MAREALELFYLMVEAAIPYAVVFALGQRVVSMMLGMAFKGRIDI